MAIYQSSFVPMLTLGFHDKSVTDDIKLRKITLSMISLGLGEALGSVINGTLQDKLGTTKMAII